MPTVKSYGIGNGDMYYIRHGSDNFTIIDCSIPEERLGSILAELTTESSDKVIKRFISTHPDQDHISGLVELDDHLAIATSIASRIRPRRRPRRLTSSATSSCVTARRRSISTRVASGAG